MAGVGEVAINLTETAGNAANIAAAAAEIAPVVDAAAGNLAEVATQTAIGAPTGAEAATSIQNLITSFEADPTDAVADQLAAAENSGQLHWEGNEPKINTATTTPLDKTTPQPNLGEGASPVVEPLGNEAATAKISPERVERVQQYVDKNMQQWEQDHPMPDSEADPKGFEDWKTDQFNKKRELEADSNFLEDVKVWDDANPEPDQSTNPEGHKKWEQDRETEKQRIKNEQMGGEKDKKTSDEESTEKDEKEAEENLNTPEGQEKLKRLLELYKIRTGLLGEKSGLEQIIKTNKEVGADSSDAEGRLGENSGKLAKVDAEIKQLEAEMKISTTKTGSLIKTILQTVAIVGGGVGLMAATGAKQAR